MSNPPTVAKVAADKIADAAGASMKVPRSAVEGMMSSAEDTRKRKFEEYQVKRSKNQKDSMELLIQELDNYEPGIPDDVVRSHSRRSLAARSRARSLTLFARQVAHYLSKGGFDAADKRSIRAVSLLAHKFIMDVADEAMQITSRRSSSRVAGAAAATGSPAPSRLNVAFLIHCLALPSCLLLLTSFLLLTLF